MGFRSLIGVKKQMVCSRVMPVGNEYVRNQSLTWGTSMQSFNNYTRQRINSTCTLPLKINLYRLCHKKWRVIKDFSLNRKGPSIRPALINFFRLFMKRAHFFRFCKIINKSDNRYNLSVAYSIVCVGTKSLLLLQSGYFVLSYLPCVCFVDNRKAWIFCAVNRIRATVPLTGQTFGVIFLRGHISLKNRT
jgi:hypothetical protein